MSLSVETPIPVLYRSLCRAGWGELAGREWQGVRSTLGAIVNRARSKQGIDCTVWQIAQSAGLSEKWTSRCLLILEGLGVITWQRGLIEEGKPKPGFITVCRHVLLDLVRQAWKQGYSKWTERRAETARRLALLKKATANIRRSRRTELSSHLNSEYLSAPQSAERDIQAQTPPPDWAIGKEDTMTSAIASDEDNPLCPHGYTKGGAACPSCNRIQDRPERRKWTKKQQAEWRNRKARENLALLNQQTEAKRIAEAAEWERLHPIPAGMSGANWCLLCQSYHERLEGQAYMEHVREHDPAMYRRMMEREGKSSQYTPDATAWIGR